MSDKKDEQRVLFAEDLARVMRCSQSTIMRRVRTNTFPVASLRRIDKRRRWSAKSIDDYLCTGQKVPRRRK